MNKEKLLEIANYLDNDLDSEFNMRDYCKCVLGHSIRLFRHKQPEIQESMLCAREFYRIASNDLAWSFLFGSQWSNDPHAAAERIRYVAIHGDAPSRDQWERFERYEAIEEFRSVMSDIDSLECECATA